MPDGVTVVPDLLPGNPGTPGFEVPAAPGAFCWVGWPCVVTPYAQAGGASATIAATATPLSSIFTRSSNAGYSTCAFSAKQLPATVVPHSLRAEDLRAPWFSEVWLYDFGL